MEQQRLFAWSETSGLLDMDDDKINNSNTFLLHRTTVIDLLVQIKVLFEKFRERAARHKQLEVVKAGDQPPSYQEVIQDPEKEARRANVPLKPRYGKYLKNIFEGKSEKTLERLRWVAFDKVAFEQLLCRFSALNDSMTGLLDARLQAEIHQAVNDTNRGVLMLHHQIADIQRLVLALDVKIDTSRTTMTTYTALNGKITPRPPPLELLKQLAQFKAFNEVIEPSRRQAPYGQNITDHLNLRQKDLKIDRSRLSNNGDGISDEQLYGHRTEAVYTAPDGSNHRVWIEWRDYDIHGLGRKHTTERIKRLAALLNYPKPEYFRTPTCIAWVDRAERPTSASIEENINVEYQEAGDSNHTRLGLVFERPSGSDFDEAPLSMRNILSEPGTWRPSITQRVKLARAIASSLLYLHSVSWLHKGIRSSNILFFLQAKDQKRSLGIDYSTPILSGFDFSRPESNDNWTEAPSSENPEFDLYRHPSAQVSCFLRPLGLPPSPSMLLPPARDPMDRETYRRSFDIYSLGTLLIEIAFWKPLKQILGVAKPNPMDAQGVREKLLQITMQSELAFHMGEVYAEATRRCIEGGSAIGLREGDDEMDDYVVAYMGMMFYENIVKPLEEISV